MVSSKRSFFGALPMWAKVLFLIFWPVSMPYFTYRMWKTKSWPTAVKGVITSAVALFMLTAFMSGALSGAEPPAPATDNAASEISTQSSADDSVEADHEQAKSAAVVSKAEPAVVEPAISFVSAEVIRIIDGDTVEVRFEDGTTDKVRFIGVDTPEDTSTKDPYGAEATAYTSKSLKGHTVLLETDVGERDRYDRLLAYVWMEEPDEITEPEVRAHLFNAWLLADGYAQLMTIQPNSKYVDYLKDYVAEARDANKGLWDPALVAEPAPAPSPAPAPAAAPPAAAPAPAPAPSPTPAAKYSASSKSEVFHYSSCGNVKQILPSNLITFSTRESAVASGRRPCKNCNP